MSAVLWCKDHIPTKTIAHHMHEMVTESGLNALQFYVQNYKQADLTLTGTVRKANLMMNAAKVSGVPTQPSGPRRTSIAGTTTTIANGAGPPARNGEPTEAATNALQPGEKVCITCGIDVTPKWWPIDDSQERKLTNGHHGVLGSEARKFVEQRKFQCHQCRKAPLLLRRLPTIVRCDLKYIRYCITLPRMSGRRHPPPLPLRCRNTWTPDLRL
ncbi:putative PHD type zinc finger protein with BAH domain-containing protein [Purpureocillium lilacinum]|nr:putative PHD type zinc finger protein with BAH domain-containing protein [Purpureocillium lilacinum]